MKPAQTSVKTKETPAPTPRLQDSLETRLRCILLVSPVFALQREGSRRLPPHTLCQRTHHIRSYVLPLLQVRFAMAQNHEMTIELPLKAGAHNQEG